MVMAVVSPQNSRIGWIGTGVMGRSMAGHLQAAGYRLAVYNRSREKAQPLLDAGATWCSSPREVALHSDVIFTMVGYPRDVREVVLGADGVFAGARQGAILVDMTSSEPALARELATVAMHAGVGCLDAPVSGGDLGARNATLSIMVGGPKGVLSAVMPLLNCLGKTIVHQGAAGAGQHTKLTNQILISTLMIGVCEALLYAYRAGLDLPTVLQSVGPGAAGSWTLSNLGPRMIENRFDPGFYVEHLIKDLGMALAESKRMGLSLPGLAQAEQLYLSVQAHGHGRLGTHALMLTLAEMSGIDWKNRPVQGTESPVL